MSNTFFRSPHLEDWTSTTRQILSGKSPTGPGPTGWANQLLEINCPSPPNSIIYDTLLNSHIPGNRGSRNKGNRFVMSHWSSRSPKDIHIKHIKNYCMSECGCTKARAVTIIMYLCFIIYSMFVYIANLTTLLGLEPLQLSKCLLAVSMITVV